MKINWKKIWVSVLVSFCIAVQVKWWPITLLIFFTSLVSIAAYDWIVRCPESPKSTRSLTT